MLAHAPQVPIIVLSSLEDEALAVEAVREGAQDYLVKGQADGNLLVRAISYAIERKRAERELQEAKAALGKRNACMEVLRRAGQTVNSTLEPEAILDRLTDEAMRLTRATHGQVLVVRQQDGCFERRSLRGFSSEEVELAGTVPMPLDQGINSRAYTTCQAIRVSDVQEEAGCFPLLPTTRAELAVPIVRDGRALGTLYLQSPEVGAFRDVELDDLSALADQVAIALTNASALHAVEQARREWEVMLNSMHDAVALVDRGRRILYANRSFLDLVRRTWPQVAGQVYRSVLDGAGCQETECPLEQPLKSGRLAQCVHKYSGRTFEVRAVPIWEEDAGEPGHAVRMVYVMRDTTERKQAEEALRESNRQLEKRERFITRLLESIPSSLVVIDRRLRIVSANRNFLEKIRRDEQTTVGHKVKDAFPQVLLDFTRLDQKVQEAFRTGQLIEGGKMAYRAPGLPTRIYYYRVVPLKAEEAVENVMLLMDDVTEREQLGEEVRRVERHLASVVDCANDLVISLDSRGHIVTWNQAAEKTSGLRTEEVQGRSMLSFCADGQRPVMAKMLQSLASGEGVENAEASLLTADGHEVPIAWSCSPMRDDARRVVGIVAVGRDLTERRRLEAQLIQSAKMASLGVMAGGIAHEVRNPLAIISAAAQLLLEHSDDAQLRIESAQKIHAATKRASQIIENLLKFSRPQRGQMGEIDLRTVLEETFALLSHQLALQKVALKRRYQSDLPRTFGNSELLQQVFTNLVLNACTAMPEGGTLTVATRAIGGGVEIRFRDTGIGIPPENLSKMFVPFFTTLPVGRGTGLGLAISYSIIQQHQGAIEVESQVGRGSTFIVRLPSISGGG
jgi:PAS domain S-box-containing protein